MPSRIIREGINSSPRINALSVEAELLYRRLMTVADDYGRYYGSLLTLRVNCFPTNPDRFREKQVAKWFNELLRGENPLIRTYIFGGITYLEVQDFNQQKRGKSKFPDPPWFKNEEDTEESAKQMQSTCLASVEANAQPSRIRSRIRISESYAKEQPAADAAGVLPFPDPISEDELIAETAGRLCARHPKQRTCAPAEAKRQLKAIVAKLPKLERSAKLASIDANHQGWCDSEQWTKDGGEYAKGLGNWLAPTKGRYDLLPPPRAAPDSSPKPPRVDRVLAALAKRQQAIREGR